jgi:glyoxylase-like metal-dependent hydrolase (beta-lactamase superfamily II)
MPAKGHSKDSIVLYDKDKKMLFAGDFIYPAGLIAYTPGADLKDYRTSAKRLMAVVKDDATIYCSHNAPKMTGDTIRHLDGMLEAISLNKLEHKRDFPFKRYDSGRDFSLVTF